MQGRSARSLVHASFLNLVLSRRGLTLSSVLVEVAGCASFWRPSAVNAARLRPLKVSGGAFSSGSVWLQAREPWASQGSG